MVDAIVSFAVNRLGDFLIQEANFLHGVKDEVKRLQDQLGWMRSFLKDAQEKQDGNEIVRLWISEIQDIAYDTEDVIESFIFKVKGQVRTSKLGVWSNPVRNCFCISTNTDLYGIGQDIEALKNRVLETSRNREIFGIDKLGIVHEGTSSDASRLRDLRLTTPYIDEHVIGFKDDVQLLEEKLFQGEPRRTVISIVGMGGLGKTTLARKLYKNSRTKFDLQGKFDLHAWVSVSQEWKTQDLLERLIKSFKRLIRDELELLEKMKDYDMEKYLHELLEGCRYLVVIDDVWHKQAWESILRALPDNNNGSRIIITTRKEDVAEVRDQRTYVHKLRFLRPGESWQLFCTKAFPETSVCPPDMKNLGEQMMAKCSGLPLAIIVLGGLLSRKQFSEWHVVKDSIWRELKKDSIHISSLLALCYKDLPHELKSCFLYLGLFPEDFEINTGKLIRLWVAEEFIAQGEEELDLEELAENYLKELIGRSLIQVVARNWRTISTCQVHDLLRDLAVHKAKELNLFHISDESMNSAPSTGAFSYRRIAFRSGFECYMAHDHLKERVRTLSFLDNEYLNLHHSRNDDPAKRLMTLFYSRFKLLRVLDLERVHVTGEIKLRFDEVVGKLIHLRYLGLNRTRIRELPDSIGNLQALQTLDISNDRRITLPRGICKLKQLRHLIGILQTEKGSPYSTPLVFEDLTNLQTLKNVDIDTFPGQNTENHLALNAFAKLKNLKFLSVQFYSNCMLSVLPLFKCRNLIELKIYGRINNLSKEMHKSLSRLKYLELGHSRLEQDPMPSLEMLPKLMVLHLNDVGVNIMTCTAKGFPHLEVLKLSKFQNSANLQVEDGAMPRLRVLSLDDSGSLIFPQRLSSLLNAGHLNWEWEHVAY